MSALHIYKHNTLSLASISLTILLVVALTSPASAALHASAAANSSITLTWTAPGDDGATGTAAVYDIRYSTSLINDANWSSAAQVTGEPSPSSAGTAESFEVTGLESSTTYYFAIKAGDEADNWSPLSNVVSRTTAPDAVPPSAIADLGASTGTSDGEIDITWSAPGDDGVDGWASSYEIRYDTDSITSGTWSSATVFASAPTPDSAGSTETLTLTGLTPGTVYYVGIIAYDEENNPSGLSNISSAEAFFEFSTGTGDEDDPTLPGDFALTQNYPNPFNPTTQIDYAVPVRSDVRIEVFNVRGQLVRTLVDEVKATGFYTVEWDGRGNGNTEVASGIYLYRIVAGEFRETKKMIMLK
ncbi:fibronectin type III domain-containing protein [bacterium]|nr:fibronectin type III domain-containing protein [bacterium]